MIIKSLRLRNIRSYVDETIDFPLGRTLFEGDIGSGKSTILMAIEFALFGLGEEKGGALLRTGSKDGSITLKFQAEDETYEIYRTLTRKRKGVQHGEEAILKTNKGELHLSTSEMKEKILEILNFNEPPNPKAKSVIFRYAVYTPQEEMKRILWMGTDERIQTLRKAFRLEDYRIARDNATNLAGIIEKRIIALESLTSDLQSRRELRKKKEDEIEEEVSALHLLLSDEEKSSKLLTANREKLPVLREKKEKLAQTVAESESLSKDIDARKGEIASLQGEVDKLVKEIDEKLVPEINELSKIKSPTDKTEETLGDEVKKQRKLEKKLSKLETTLETKMNDYVSIQETGICPTCDRPANPDEFKEKIEEKRLKLDQTTKEVQSCGRTIEGLEQLQAEVREYSKNQERLKELKEQEGRNRNDIEKYQKMIEPLAEQVDKMSRKIKDAEKHSKELEQVRKQIEELEEENEKLEKQLRETRDKISSTKGKVEQIKKEVSELSEEIKQKEQKKLQTEKLKEYHIWLDGFFVPTIESIERHVMLSINQEFNQHFQKWFSLLVEDPGKEARIDEDFTPLVEQDGYEQDIYYLSGGEKTSVALAYRLALNNIVQMVSTSMKSNLLILDEPTDGFSKEQLYKVREILDEIKCPQVIIVSHEKELESFADQVLKVEKTQGISKVTT